MSAEDMAPCGCSAAALADPDHQEKFHRLRHYEVVTASDGCQSIIVSDTDECTCPPGLVGLDMACRVHGLGVL